VVRHRRTRHYSVAQIVDLRGALEKIKDDARRWNKSFAVLKLEQRELGTGVPQKPQPVKAA